MIQMDLTTATPDDKAACFGEAFRHVQMGSLWTTPAGEVLTRVVLDGRPVTLVGDPETALAVYRAQGKALAISRLAAAFWDGLTGALLVPVAIWESARAAWAQRKGRKTP